MRLRVAIGGTDVSASIHVDSAHIQQDSREAVSTCDLSYRAPAASRYGTARYGVGVYAAAVREWDELVVWDQDTAGLLFAGFILSVQQAPQGREVRYELACSDWGILFERAVITQSWPAGTPDSTVITDVLAAVPQLSAGVIVPQVGDVGALEYKDARARDILDQICELTGAEWAVGYDGKLNYYRQGSIVAPFGLSDHPNGTSTIGYSLEDYASDFSDAANRILVLGGLTDAGEVRAAAEDLSSQAQYGVLSITLVERNLTDAVTAGVWAQTEVQTRAWPKPTIKVVVWEPGLARGQTVEIEAAQYGLDTSLILRSLEIVIAAPDRRRPVSGHILKYTATLGWRPPDLVYSLRRMQRRPAQPTLAPAQPITPGSIDPGDFASGIAPVYLVSAKPTDWALYPADAVFLNTADNKLYRRTTNDWTAVVNAGEIEGQLQTSQFAPGSITSTILADGSVVTAKIPAGAIQAPQIAASAVTANAIAANSIYSLAIQANAVTAQAIAANAITAGKIAALAIQAGHIAADAVTAGAIAAGAVNANALAANSVAAGKIAAGAVTSTTIAANAVTAGTIAAQAIDSTKLNAFEISVGGGGSKPGRFGVYDGAGSLVALIGDLTGAGVGAYGIWAKVGAFGGTNYSNAPFYTDTGGNLYLRQANLTITASDGSYIQTSPTTFDPTYGTIALNVVKAGDSSAALVSRGVVVRNSSGSAIGALVRDPSFSAGVLALWASGGAQNIVLSGQTGDLSAAGAATIGGLCRAGSFAKTGGSVGVDEFMTIGGVNLRFQGGLYVGHATKEEAEREELNAGRA
jgi:hypothetical protein